MAENKFSKPFLGTAYYPEDWDESDWPYDIQMMNKAGIKCARIGEFAWRKMEPKKGEFHFEWLHKIVDSLGAAGIKTVLGTPTACPPIWLFREHPDYTQVDANGIHSNHGGRRHGCSNNPDYIAASRNIVEAMAKEFADDENVIGWQIDNEIYTWGDGCCCEHCVKAYRENLKEKYGTIENLNSRWNLNVFSQEFDSFEDISAPVHAWINPHNMYEWRVFQNESNIRFIHMQNDILKKYTKALIGTDMMPLNGLDYEKMTEKLDVVQFNHYNDEHNLNTCMFWFDFIRTMKDVPFWNTETQTSWNGSVGIGQIMKPEGFCRVNSWLPVAMGGEANMYWLWRQHWAGQELNHGSVISPEGRPLHIFGEVQRTADEFEKAADFINGTTVQTDIGLMYTSLAWNLNDVQPVTDHFNYTNNVIESYYKPLSHMGLRPDVIGAHRNLDDYKIIFSPFIISLEDGDLPERLEQWINDGGIWIAGPKTDIRNSIGAHYRNAATGMLERITGSELSYYMPDSSEYVKSEWDDGKEFKGKIWHELYTPADDAESLVTVTGTHSAIVGKSVVFRTKVGKGEVIVLGSIPSENDMKEIITIAAADAGIAIPECSGNLCVVHRTGNGFDGLILAEVENGNASYTLTRPMKDILSGKTYSGKVELRPYDMLILD